MIESENSSIQIFFFKNLLRTYIVLDASNIVGDRLYAASWKLYLSIY